MNEVAFKREMVKTKTMQQNSDNPEYWVGVQRGLRRGHHGEKFGTEEEHQLWLSAADDADETRRQRGKGYRDGLTMAEIGPSKPGPKTDEPSIPLSVRLPKSVHDAIPEPKGEWVRNLVRKNVDAKKPYYCTQNNGDCITCSLVNYGRDCHNNPIEKLE
jgi:hypothetical protein